MFIRADSAEEINVSFSNESFVITSSSLILESVISTDLSDMSFANLVPRLSALSLSAFSSLVLLNSKNKRIKQIISMYKFIYFNAPTVLRLLL